MLGKLPVKGHYGNHNPFVTMLANDTWQRLTTPNFEGDEVNDYLFFPEVLDNRLNIWNYIFYLTVLFGIYKVWKQAKGHRISYFKAHPMLLYAICIITPLSVLLTFAAGKHDWYLAPAFVFIAYIIAYGIICFSRFSKLAYVIPTLLFLFTMVRQWSYINGQESKLPEQISQNPAFQSSEQILVVGPIKQNIYLHVTWLNKPIRIVNTCQPQKNNLLVLNKKPGYEDCIRNARLIQTIADYYFVVE